MAHKRSVLISYLDIKRYFLYLKGTPTQEHKTGFSIIGTNEFTRFDQVGVIWKTISGQFGEILDVAYSGRSTSW
jgi:hypothetical protein